MNPFQSLPHLYDKDVMGKYRGAALHELSPHPFAIADSAYRQTSDITVSELIKLLFCFYSALKLNGILSAGKWSMRE